jgi:ubiquitin carboxyl-terminal hydrolase 7
LCSRLTKPTSDIAKRFEQEIALKEARKKEQEEEHLYMNVKVITEDIFKNHGGTDLAVFDSKSDSDPATPRVYRILRVTTMSEFVAKVAHDIQKDPYHVRLWIMVNRQNKTIRPDQPIVDLKATVEETFQRAAAHRDPALRLWAEVAEEVDADGVAVWPSFQTGANGVVVTKNDTILIFLKVFDVESQTLRGVGHIHISKEKKVEDIVPLICKKMGWPEKLPSDEKVLLLEVSLPQVVVHRYCRTSSADTDMTLRAF